MLIPTGRLLTTARTCGHAVGAFNVYNLEGAVAVIQAAEELESPVILQVLPSALALGGNTLTALCMAAAESARIPAAVQLDHCRDPELIGSTLNAGISSVMADGSALSFEENIAFTRKMVERASGAGSGVEAELGCLSGSEDGITVDDYQAQLTRPDQAEEFVRRTGVAALAVCIGNRHGRYTRPPDLDFPRLDAIAARVKVPLVLHGTSGLGDDLVSRAMGSGVCKFNVNTEIRSAYLKTAARVLEQDAPELVDLMARTISAVKEKAMGQMIRFGSHGAAKNYTQPKIKNK